MSVDTSVCRKCQGKAEPGNSCLQTPGTCESCPDWEKVKDRSPISDLELSIVRALQNRVTFPPGSSHKRFVHRLSDRSVLSDRGRQYLAYIAHRYRRQWTSDFKQSVWIAARRYEEACRPTSA